MFSSVILTPLGVNSGRPSGNPSMGSPLTCLPSTATRGFSGNLRAGLCCCLGRRGSFCLAGNLDTEGAGLGWSRMSWMILMLDTGVVTEMGEARRKLVPRDSSVSRASELLDSDFCLR